MITRLKATKMLGKEHTIFGHSGCGGYALTVNSQEFLSFKVRCVGPDFSFNYILPLNYYVTIAVVYDGKVIYGYINGVLFN
jgi:hypothetical protein